MNSRSSASYDAFPSLSSGIGADVFGLRQFESSLDRIVSGRQSQERPENEPHTATYNSRFQFFNSKRTSAINEPSTNDIASREDSLVKAWRTVSEIDALLGSDFRPSMRSCEEDRPSVDDSYVKRLNTELEAALNLSLTFKERLRISAASSRRLIVLQPPGPTAAAGPVPAAAGAAAATASVAAATAVVGGVGTPAAASALAITSSTSYTSLSVASAAAAPASGGSSHSSSMYGSGSAPPSATGAGAGVAAAPGPAAGAGAGGGPGAGASAAGIGTGGGGGGGAAVQGGGVASPHPHLHVHVHGHGHPHPHSHPHGQALPQPHPQSGPHGGGHSGQEAFTSPGALGAGRDGGRGRGGVLVF